MKNTHFIGMVCDMRHNLQTDRMQTFNTDQYLDPWCCDDASSPDPGSGDKLAIKQGAHEMSNSILVVDAGRVVANPAGGCLM
ncbi:MAG TPA: hypothetical protein VFJ15_01350 [Oleiagrimonas sp.]|nr:hypothetical protein [Oleiagrimonas sp.]